MDIEKAVLTKAIGLVIPGLARKEVFAQANKLAFEKGRLISYNDEVAIFHPLPGSEDIAGAVDGKRLYELLGKASNPTVTLAQKGNELEVRIGRVKATLALAPVVLPFAEVDWTGEYQMLPDTDVFKKALKLVVNTCARDMNRPVLTCVSLAGECMSGADGYRLAQFRFAGAELPHILVPVTAAELLSDDGYRIDRLAVGTRGEWARFATAENTVICTRLAAGDYPDLVPVLAVEGQQITLPERLRSTLVRARIFATREHRLDEEVKVTLRGPQIVVSANCEGGRFEEIIRAEQEATGEFTIHPDFLAAALAAGNAACILGSNRIKFAAETWQHVVALR